MHKRTRNKIIRVFEGFAGYGGGSFGLKRLKENIPDIDTDYVINHLSL